MTDKKKEPEKLRKITKKQTENYRKSRANVFMENALQNYLDAFGVTETVNRLEYYKRLLEGATK